MENKATKRTNRLGRGLSALIPDSRTDIDKEDSIRREGQKIEPHQERPGRVCEADRL